MEAQRRLGRLARADQVSVIEASNLRDLIRQQDDGRESLAGLTLAAVLGCEDMRKAPTRTLMDIIKDEESGAAYRGLSLPNQHQQQHQHREKSWRSFKGRIRLRRAGVAWSSSSNPVNGEDYNLEISPPIPVPSALRIPQLSDLIPVDLPQSTRNVRENESIGVGSGNSQNAENLHPQTPVPAPTTTIRLSAALEAEREEQRRAAAREIENEATVEEEEETVTPHPEAPRMSLMALLEETDRDAGMRYGMEEGEEDEGGEEEGEMECGGDGDGEEREGGGPEYVCCVCMVRHKGAAFIPCGHTFCRLCSRELWVSRGNCPLCNAYILEILDIF